MEKKYLNYLLLSFMAFSLMACKEERLFQTVEAEQPLILENWTDGERKPPREGGRAFRLENPLTTTIRSFDYSLEFNANDGRKVVALEVWVQPVLNPYGGQGWFYYDSKVLATPSETLLFEHTIYYDEVSYGMFGSPTLATGYFGITSEDNIISIFLYFEDGTNLQLADMVFSYPLVEEVTNG